MSAVVGTEVDYLRPSVLDVIASHGYSDMQRGVPFDARGHMHTDTRRNRVLRYIVFLVWRSLLCFQSKWIQSVFEMCAF